MVRRVVSVVRGAPVALRGIDPVLEVNAYAVAEALDLAVVLAGPAVELALDGGGVSAAEIAGVALEPTAHHQDLLGLLESGVAVYVDHAELDRLGVGPEDLVEGIRVVDAASIADVLRDAEAVLAW